MAGNEEPVDGNERRVDALARSAGAALRRPAPADGVARVRSSQRRRRRTMAVAGVSAVALMGAGVFALVDRGGDDDSVVTETVPAVSSTVAPTTTPITMPATTPATTAPTTTSTTTTTTTSPPTSAWQPTTEPFPQLAFFACCGSNWQGDPSPAVPADPAAPLAAGLYHVQRVGEVDTDVLELRPFTRCSELAESECSDSPVVDDELGLPANPARTIDLPLDDASRVVVFGFACEDDELQRDVQAGTGADLAALHAELDAAYETFVAVPLRTGVVLEDIAAGLLADPASGFYEPVCPSYGNLAWEPAVGPGILTPLSLETVDGVPRPEPAPSASVAYTYPTALAVDEQGLLTLYVFAGFSS